MTPSLIRPTLPLLFTLLASLLLFPSITSAQAPAADALPDDTAFGPVMEQLDTNGDILMFWSLADIHAGIDDLLKKIEPTLKDMGEFEKENVELGKKVIVGTGLSDLAALGYSSIRTDNDFKRNKWVLTQSADAKPDSLLWNLYPKAENKLFTLRHFPQNTAVALVGDLDIKTAYRWLKENLKDTPAEDAMAELVEGFSEEVFDLERGLKALNGDWGYAVTLDPERKIDSPFGMIPAPGFVFMANLNDPFPFQKILDILRENAPEIKERTFGETAYHTFPIDDDTPFPLLPSFAYTDGQAIFASTAKLMNEVLAAKTGKGDSLLKQKHFKTLATKESVFANQVSYISPEAGKLLQSIMNLAREEDPEFAIVADMIAPADGPPMHMITNLKRIDSGYITTTTTNAKGMARFLGGPLDLSMFMGAFFGFIDETL